MAFGLEDCYGFTSLYIGRRKYHSDDWIPSQNFPATVTSETVKKYQLAPNSESYVINALQFVGLIDEEGKRTSRGHDVLLLPEGQFEEAFETLVREAYSDLFQLRGEDAWTMGSQSLSAILEQLIKPAT